MENLISILARKAIEVQKYEDILQKSRSVDEGFLADPQNVRIEMFRVMKESFGPFLQMPEEHQNKIFAEILDREEIFSCDSISKLSYA